MPKYDVCLMLGYLQNHSQGCDLDNVYFHSQRLRLERSEGLDSAQEFLNCGVRN